jgi:hypothetical protein
MYQLVDLIRDKAVALRLKAGSDEAGYLAQIFPLPQTPTVVIMKDGELKEYLTPATSKEDFIRRVQTAFSAQPPAAPAAASSGSATTSAAAEAGPASAQSDGGVAAPSVESQQQSDSVRRILAERAARLQAEKEAADKKAREQRAKAKEQGKADSAARENTSAAQAHQQAELVKKKKQQAVEERQRILKRIQDDREERRLRAEEREKQRIESTQLGDVAASLVNAPETKLSASKAPGDMAALQMRLFDGSILRSRFKTKSPLRDVRAWVDQNRTDGSEPYTFRQILSPLPNKTIDATEENKSLGDLGLGPSATMVLIPVPKFTTAYEQSDNPILRFFGMIMGFVIWLLSFVGLGPTRAVEGAFSSPTGDGAGESAGSSSPRSRIQGFDNARDRRRDQQLYNGNSVSQPILDVVSRQSFWAISNMQTA